MSLDADGARMIRELLTWVEQHEDEIDPDTFSWSKPFARWLQADRSLSDKQRTWLRNVYEKTLDVPDVRERLERRQGARRQAPRDVHPRGSPSPPAAQAARPEDAVTAPLTLPEPPAVPGGVRGRRPLREAPRRPSGQACRTGQHALLLRQFVDAMREVIGKDPLYGDGRGHATEDERFYRPAARPFSYGRTPTRGSET